VPGASAASASAAPVSSAVAAAGGGGVGSGVVEAPSTPSSTLRSAALPRASPTCDEAEDAIPDDFICPLTLEVMLDPVVACDGFTYDRKSIESWFEKHAGLPSASASLAASAAHGPDWKEPTGSAALAAEESHGGVALLSPMTGKPLRDTRLVPNQNLKSQILEWLVKHRRPKQKQLQQTVKPTPLSSS
jgi:hypothetical protein